jgi:hypothetical protein
MHVRRIAPFLLALAFAGPAAAQSSAVLSGKNDATFARKLYERGYTDMAEAICSLLEKGGKLSGNDAVTVKSLHIDLRLDLARKITDLTKKKDEIKVALQDKEDFVRQHQGTPEGEIASLSMPDAYALLGDTIKALIQQETQPTVIADYQAEGGRVYQEAEDRLKMRIEELQKLASEKEEEDLKLTEQIMAARFSLPRTMYGHAQLFPKDEWKRKDLLENAIKLIQEFGLDYSGVAYSYNAAILEGLCEKELGNFDDALAVWSGVINELSGTAADPVWEVKNGQAQIDPATCNVVAVALLQKLILYTELNRTAEGIAEAKDYFTRLRSAYEVEAGLAVLAQLGELQLLAGDSAGVEQSANKLIEIDGNGPWGNSGRVLLDKVLGKSGPTLGADKLVALATTQFNRGNTPRALELCRQAVKNAASDPAQAKTGLDAFRLMGEIFRSRGWMYEATVAYDAGVERFGAVDDAAELVYLSVLSFQEINKEEKRPYFKKRIDERMKLLTSRYANHARASFALILEGQGYESEDDFLKAAETYEKVQPGARSYLQAQYQAGNAYFLHARKLAKDASKKAEAKPFFEQAITKLKKSVADLDKQADEIFDLTEQNRVVGMGFRARIALAQVYLDENVAQVDETLKSLEGLDENKKFSNDPDKLAAIWNLRIRAFNEQGKLEDAAKLLDGLILKTPDSPAIASAAGAVAREYDVRAAKAAEGKDDKAKREAQELWKRAAKYYRTSGLAMLKGSGGRDVAQVAERLYVLGLILNNVEGDTFLGWKGARSADTDYWSLAADLYDASLRQAPSRSGLLYLARAHGFLGQWARASDAYAQFFEGINLIDAASGRFSNSVLGDKENAKLGVLPAYVEWGVSENRAAKAAGGDADRFARALGIFSNVAKNPAYVPVDSKLWWYFKYDQIDALKSKGDYPEAGRILRDAERQTPALGKPAGLEDEFKQLKNDIAKNTFEKNGIQAKPAAGSGR